MRVFSKCRTWLSIAVFAFAMVLSAITAEAKTINKSEVLEKSLYTVGDEYSTTSYGNITINNKVLKKSKKKVKAVKTRNNPTSFSYHTKSYFRDYSSAYSGGYDEYNDAYYNSIKYIGSSSYTLIFLKPGTYKIKYASYSKEDLRMVYENNGYRLKDSEGNSMSDDVFERKTLNGREYYQGVTSGKIYGYSYESYSNGVVEASIKKGADGKDYLYYQPMNIIKTTHTKEIKVVTSKAAQFSVQLGKAKRISKETDKAYGKSSSSTTAPFLSGSSGKLKVKSLNKNFSITSIVVATYDKEGNVVYKQVKNNDKVTYGTNYDKYDYASETTTYARHEESMYKPTIVYIGYKNNFTGEFSKFSVEQKTDYQGKPYQSIKSTYRFSYNTEDRETSGFYGPCYTHFSFYKK